MFLKKQTFRKKFSCPSKPFVSKLSLSKSFSSFRHKQTFCLPSTFKNLSFQQRSMTLSIQRRNKRRKGLNVNYQREAGDMGSYEETDEGIKIGGAVIPENFVHFLDPDHIRGSRYVHRNRKQERKVESLQHIHARSHQRKEFRLLLDPEDLKKPKYVKGNETLRQVRLSKLAHLALDEIFDSILNFENRWFNVSKLEVVKVDINSNISLATIYWECHNLSYIDKVKEEMESQNIQRQIRFHLTSKLSWLKSSMKIRTVWNGEDRLLGQKVDQSLQNIEDELEMTEILGTAPDVIVAQYEWKKMKDEIEKKKNEKKLNESGIKIKNE